MLRVALVAKGSSTTQHWEAEAQPEPATGTESGIRSVEAWLPGKRNKDPSLTNTSSKFRSSSNEPAGQTAVSFDSELPVKPNIEEGFMVMKVLKSFLIIGVTARITKAKQTEAEEWK